MLTKDSKDYIKVDGLNRNIQTQIRNLCSSDYFGTNCVDDLPFFCFHINFKKSILESILKDAVAKEEIKQTEIDKLLSIFTVANGKIVKIEDVSLVTFKLGKLENHTKFDMQLFVTYTSQIIKLLQKSSYKKFVNALCAVTSTEGVTVEDLGKGFKELKEILDDEPETFFWNELKSTSLKDGKVFYRLNSEVEKSFYYSKGVLSYPKDDEEKKSKRVDRNIFLSSFGSNESVAEKELREYYDNLYSLLINDVVPIDSSIVISTLSTTFRMLLKMQFGSAVEEAMLEKSKTESGTLTLSDLGDYLGVHTATFGERLKNMYLPKIPDIEELYKISFRLNKTTDSLLGLELHELGFDFSESEVQKYITDKYGLYPETLKLLESLQRWFEDMKLPKGRNRLNNGLNVLLSSKYIMRTPIHSNDSFFIKITNSQMNRLKNLYDKGVELKENTDIDGSVAAGYREKKSEKMVVRYNKRNLIITEDDIKIVRTVTKEEYYFDGVEVKREKAMRNFKITQGSVTNIAFIDDIWGSFFDIDLKRYRNMVIGDEETDFLTPLLRYLGGDGSTFTIISKNDLDSLYEGFEEGEFAVDEFYQEVSTNYGSLAFETDNLILLEILTRLKNFKNEK